MYADKKDDYLIVVSTVVAILASKFADFILPSVSTMHVFNNGFDPWIALLTNIVIIIAVTLFVFVPVIKWLTTRAMKED